MTSATEVMNEAVRRYYEDPEYHALVERVLAIMREDLHTTLGRRLHEGHAYAARFAAGVAIILQESGNAR